MSKPLNSVLNSVVRELFEDDANGYGPAVYNWGDVVNPDTYTGEDGKTYFKTGDDTPTVVAKFENPATVADRVEQFGKDAAEFGRNAYAKLGELDRNINAGAQALDDKVIRPYIEPAAKNAGTFLAGLGQDAADLGAKGIRLAGKGLGSHTIEDFGAAHDPSMTWTDKVEKFFRHTGDNISDAYGNAKDAVVGAWNDATPAQKAAALGALGTTALASGAGALYLRKKQREANKAAGRK